MVFLFFPHYFLSLLRFYNTNYNLLVFVVEHFLPKQILHHFPKRPSQISAQGVSLRHKSASETRFIIYDIVVLIALPERKPAATSLLSSEHSAEEIPWGKRIEHSPTLNIVLVVPHTFP